MPIVCFCNENGGMNGIDPHEFIAFGPAGKPIPIPMAQHFVSIAFDRKLRTKGHQDVTMDGRASFEQGADFYLVVHVPLPPLMGIGPHPDEAAELAKVIAGSGTKMFMGVHGVTIGGGWAATCLDMSSGKNMNCADPLDQMCGYVENVNSVITRPTAGDYEGSRVAAWLDAAIGMAIGKGLGKGLDKIKGEKLKDLLEQVGKHTTRRSDKAKDITPELEWADPGKYVDMVKERVQKSIDGELGSAQ